MSTKKKLVKLNEEEKSIKMQVSLFRISYESIKRVIKDKKGKISDFNTPLKFIEYMTNSLKGRKPQKLALNDVTKSSFMPFEISMYFCNVSSKFQWRNFFLNHIDDNHDDNSSYAKIKNVFHPSILFFIYDDEKIYAFTGGLGSYYIKDFVDDDFGISVLERMGDPKSLKFRMARSNNIAGNVSINSRVFRGSHRTNDEDKVGKIYGQVNATIESDDTKFNAVRTLIFNERTNQISIEAKASLKFSKLLDLTDLKDIIDFIESLSSVETLTFSTFKKVSHQRGHGKSKINRLTQQLMDQTFNIFQSYKDEVEVSCSNLLELTHFDYENFYNSTSIIVTRRGNENVITIDSPFGIMTENILYQIYINDKAYIDKKIIAYKNAPNSKKNKIKNDLVRSYGLSCYIDTESDDPMIKDRLLNCISCEIEEDQVPHFLINRSWYISKENSIIEIDDTFKKIYQIEKLNFPLNLMWGEDAEEGFKETENSFIEFIAENISNYPKTLVMHRITPSEYKLELCDLMSWDEKNVYLIHVKPSFDGAVRVLEKQIEQSAKLISEDLRTNQTDHLGIYYNQTQSTKLRSGYMHNIKKMFQGLTIEEFKEMFKTKTINYVACIVDPVSKRSLDNIEDFRSNIAKMCIIQLYRTLRQSVSYNSRLRICEIKVDQDYTEPRS